MKQQNQFCLFNNDPIIRGRLLYLLEVCRDIFRLEEDFEIITIDALIPKTSITRC